MVDGGQLRLLASFRSAYSFAKTAIETGHKLRDLLSTDLSGVTLDYSELLNLKSKWRFQASFNHPEPARCLVSAAGHSEFLCLGSSLKGHGDPIWVTAQETEVSLGDLAAIYIVGPDGAPRRVGVSPALAIGGLARNIFLGPELVLDPVIASVEGSAKLLRAGAKVWEHRYSSRGGPLLYALASLEPDHFAYADHHRPGDAHVHFIARRLFPGSPTTPIRPGDQVEVQWDGLGMALANPVQFDKKEERRIVATPL
jgi:hypothetical protein